jgi:hypothetical protein
MKVKVSTEVLKEVLYRKGVWGEREYIIIEGEEYKEDRCWFVNSRGEVQKSLIPSSIKHQVRIAFGNAFRSREEALGAVGIIKNTLHEHDAAV